MILLFFYLFINKVTIRWCLLSVSNRIAVMYIVQLQQAIYCRAALHCRKDYPKYSTLKIYVVYRDLSRATHNIFNGRTNLFWFSLISVVLDNVSPWPRTTLTTCPQKTWLPWQRVSWSPTTLTTCPPGQVLRWKHVTVVLK